MLIHPNANPKWRGRELPPRAKLAGKLPVWQIIFYSVRKFVPLFHWLPGGQEVNYTRFYYLSIQYLVGSLLFVLIVNSSEMEQDWLLP